MTEKHPNSHVVIFYRKDSFIHEAQRASAPEYVKQAKKGIGSYWENTFSRSIGSGLNFTEQKLLLPTLIDCEPEDRTFRTKVSAYYAGLSTQVPYDKGRSMEIGLEKSNEEPLSVTNMPLHLEDYIRYRHAIRHPLVALSREEAAENMLKEFYLFDPTASEKSTLDLADQKDKAMETYLKIKKENNAEKIDMVLTMLLVDPRTITGTNVAKLKLEQIKEIAERDASRFLQVIDNQHFNELYVLQSLINVGIFEQIGSKVISKDEGMVIGHTTAESIAYIKDPKNSEKIALLRARMQEALSTPLPATKKVTRRS